MEIMKYISSALKAVTIICIMFIVQACSHNGYAGGKRSLSSFFEHNLSDCYDRQKEPYTSVVDTHLHFRPFGGKAIPFEEISAYLNKSGVVFANVYGIGQRLPINSKCTYYLNCPGTPALPSIKNDFVNAANYIDFKPKNIHLTFSMTFPDLSNPNSIVDFIKLYDKEYPGLFKWMGEVNLIKQALLKNQHIPANIKHINQWQDFMLVLRERNIPINIHSDLGNNDEPAKYAGLMKYVLTTYPDNKIIWAHMGLSKELSSMSAEEHIKIMSSFLKQHRNLILDISWRIIYDNYFSNPENRDLYVKFLNQYSRRILPGTDFVASDDKNYQVYASELEINSRINQYLNDEAFRNIALGQNYFRLLGLDDYYKAPPICMKN